jgi:SAM-dependent methyltransferase
MSDLSERTDAAPSYALGHTDRELERLHAQARLVEPITRRFFREAGIAPGMRVLDVGSGVGDVAFLAAELVGDEGEVVGTDPGPAALVVARRRADEKSLHNVSFRDGDPTEMTFEQRFDAVVGRYVLMFLRDPAAALRKLAGHLKPGGVMVFHEIDFDAVQSYPPVPTYDQCCRWNGEALRLCGGDTRMGMKLHSTFVAAGLPAPSMRLEAVIGGGAAREGPLIVAAELARTLLPDMERLGVATAAEVGIETLAERMRNEAAASGSVVARHSEIGAWSRV